MRILQSARLLDEPTRTRHAPTNLDDPLLRRLDWLVAEIQTAYGAATDLATCEAICDFVHRHAVHPYPLFHSAAPAGYGRETLPAGTERTQINSVAAPDGEPKRTSDGELWAAYGGNGYASLCYLLGLDPATGLYDAGRAAPMDRVGAAQWRMTSISAFPYVLCTFQDWMMMVLWAAAGYQGMLISTTGHDPACVWVPSLGKWVYMCATYGERLTLTSDPATPLSPTELLAVCRSGRSGEVVAKKTIGSGSTLAPSWATGSFQDPAWARCTYMDDGHPGGMEVMGSGLKMDARFLESGQTLDYRLVQIDVPALYAAPYNAIFTEPGYARVSSHVAFPDLGCAATGISLGGEVVSIRLGTGQSGAAGFSRSVGAGGWVPCGSGDVVARGLGLVRYRSADATGRPSAELRITV